MQTLLIFKIKYSRSYVSFVKYKEIKNIYSGLKSRRFFSSDNVKLKASIYTSIKDLTSNLQAESSADAARRITRNPNPNRIASLVRRIYVILIESDLDLKINKMNDLLQESFWAENRDMGDRAKVALDKMLRHEVLEGEEVFCIDDFFIKEGISLEGLRLEDLRSKIETCQNFYTEKYSDLEEKLKEWNEEKNNLLLEQEESNDKGKQPDFSLHPSYYISQDINSNSITQKDDFNLLTNKRKFSDFNGLDPCDEGKIVKKAKITHNTSLLDDYADVSCEPLDIIDLDG